MMDDVWAFSTMHTYWKKSVRKAFWILLIVYLLIASIMALYFSEDPEYARDFIDEIYSEFVAEAEGGLSWDDVMSAFGFGASDSAQEDEDIASVYDDVEDTAGSTGPKLAPKASAAPTEAPAGEPTETPAEDIPYDDSAQDASSSASLDAATLFSHNLEACLLAVICGLVPFLFIPLWIFALNAVALGAAAGAALGGGMTWKMLLASLLPHGIIEIPAMMLAFALGCCLCMQLSRKIFRSKTAHPLSAIKHTVMMFILFVLPMLLIAACIEAYLTPVAILWVMQL